MFSVFSRSEKSLFLWPIAKVEVDARIIFLSMNMREVSVTEFFRVQ